MQAVGIDALAEMAELASKKHDQHALNDHSLEPSIRCDGT
jgi:hypothetical protein